MGTLDLQRSWAKWVYLLLAAISLAFLASCGGSSNNQNGFNSGTFNSGSSNNGGSNSGGSGSGGSGGGGGNGGGGGGNGGGNGSSQIPSVQHVVLVVLENTNYDSVVGSPNAPY